MPEAPRPSDKARYASASGPVNRRTTRPLAPPASPAPPVHHVVQQRLARNAVQQALGTPLVQQLAVPPELPQGGKTMVLATAGATLSAAAGLWAAVQTSLIWGVASVLCVASTVGYALSQRGRKPASPNAPAVEPQALVALDKILSEIAVALPAETLQSLIALKASLVRIAQRMGDGSVNEHFTQDDGFYVRELVRRYLPDSLSAYLQVPPTQRHLPGPQGGKSANLLLQDQIAMLCGELSHRECLLAQDSHAALQQQERFLKAKHGP